MWQESCSRIDRFTKEGLFWSNMTNCSKSRTLLILLLTKTTSGARTVWPIMALARGDGASWQARHLDCHLHRFCHLYVLYTCLPQRQLSTWSLTAVILSQPPKQSTIARQLFINKVFFSFVWPWWEDYVAAPVLAVYPIPSHREWFGNFQFENASLVDQDWPAALHLTFLLSIKLTPYGPPLHCTGPVTDPEKFLQDPRFLRVENKTGLHSDYLSKSIGQSISIMIGGGVISPTVVYEQGQIFETTISLWPAISSQMMQCLVGRQLHPAQIINNETQFSIQDKTNKH